MRTEYFDTDKNENAEITPKRTFMFNTRNVVDVSTLLGNLYVDYYVIFRGIVGLEPED